jgi:hypothetical protein
MLPAARESSPGKWCRTLSLISSVKPSAVQAAMSSASLSLLSREISFSDTRSQRVDRLLADVGAADEPFVIGLDGEHRHQPDQ